MDVMSSIDFLQIGHRQQSDARMMVEINVTDSKRVELAAVHRLFELFGNSERLLSVQVPLGHIYF